MIIYNSKEMETKYMAKDEVVIEIHSLYSPEEMLTRLRAGEELSEDMAAITAYSALDGKIITQDQFIPEESTSAIGYNTTLSPEEIEEYEDDIAERARNRMFQAYEAFQFNRPWRGFEFTPIEITKEDLMTELYAALGIMPTIKDIPEKNITELKKMSASGDRLYWSFAEVNHNNKLPSRADIEFYDSLSDYERRIIDESGVHPMKLLDIARGLKEGDPGRLLTAATERIAHVYDVDCVINVVKIPWANNVPWANNASSKKDAYLSAWMEAERAQCPHDCFGDGSFKFVSPAGDLHEFATLADIQQAYNEEIFKCANEEERKSVKALKQKTELAFFMKKMIEERVYPQYLLDELLTRQDPQKFYSELSDYYTRVFFGEFIPLHTEGDTVAYTEEDMKKFAEDAYTRPVPRAIRKADEIFKELFHGHSPRVLTEYMYGQFLAQDINPHEATDAQIRKIAENFDQKNVAKVAKFKNPILFALADKLNYNEVKLEHIQALAIFVMPNDIKHLIKRGFVSWYQAHKDTNISELVELLNISNKIEQFKPEKSAKDLITDITQAKGKLECELMENRYHYSFADNELAIRGRHVVAQEGKMKMYMLSKEDYRNFTVGYDTSCCQHYGGAGESCVYKLTTDPFAGCVIIERDGAILAQGFVWTDEAQDTLVFDNVEFANDRNVGQFNNLFAAWCRAMPYKNIHVGVGYNQGMHSWGKKVTYQAVLPTTISGGRCYSDYHTDARALKTDGAMLIQEKVPVRVTTKEDEPTRWDVLARPETAFWLNDYESSIESRLSFARTFLENQTPEIQMAAIQKNLNAIKYIEHPTEEVQKHVIRTNPKLATLIKDPCLQVQKILLDLDPAYIRHIENPDEEMCRLAVQHNGLLLGEINNPSDAVIQRAVEQNGYAIRFVPEEKQSEILQRTAVKSNPKVVSLLKSPSEAVQRMAVEYNPHVISLIEHPSRELQIYAVEREPSVINEIKDPEYDAVRHAVEKNGLLVRNFQYQYPQLRAVALRQNGFVINALRNPTDEEYVLAVKQNRAVARSIRNPELLSNVMAAVNRQEQERAEEDPGIEFD